MTALTGAVRQPRFWLRLLVLVALPVVFMLVFGDHAWADDCHPYDKVPNLLCTPPKPDGSTKVLGIFDVVDKNGVPLSAYSLNIDQGGTLDVISKIIAFLIGIGFSLLKIIVGFACWLVDWALDFGLAKVLLAPVSDIAHTVYVKIVESLGLKILFLTIVALFAGYHILFKQRAKGWAEIGLSLVIASVATVSLANPGAVLMGDGKKDDSGVLGTSKVFALAVADTILENNCTETKPQPGQDNKTTACSGQKKGDGGSEAVSRPLTDGLVDAFVTRPSFVLYTGKSIDDACSNAYSKSILVRYNWNRLVLPQLIKDKANEGFFESLGDAFKDFFSVDGMKEALLIGTANPWAIATAVNIEQQQELDQLKDKAKSTPSWKQYVDPADAELAQACHIKTSKDADSAMEKQQISASLDNLLSVWFIALAALIVVVLVVAVSATFLISQVWMAIEVIRIQPAMVAGILPGGGRQFMWNCFAGVIRVVLAIMVSIWFLAFFLVLVLAFLSSPNTGDVMTIKFVSIVILAIAFLAFRGKVTAGAKNIAKNFTDRMSSKTGGAVHPDDVPVSAFSNAGQGSKSPLRQLGDDKETLGKIRAGAGRLWRGKGAGGGGGGGGTAAGSGGKTRKGLKQRVQGAVKLGTEVAVAAGTGGGSAAAKVAAKTALKQRLKKSAKNRLEKSRVGRGALTTARTGRYIAKEAPVTRGRFKNAVAAERRNLENTAKANSTSQRTRDARRDASRRMRDARNQARSESQRLNRAVNGRRNQQRNQRRSTGGNGPNQRGNRGGGRGR